MEQLAQFAILSALLIVVLSLFGVVLYVLMSIGLYRLASKAGIQHAWLSWIPIGNFYILGMLLSSIQLGSLEVPSLQIVLPVAFVVYLIFRKAAVLGVILSLLMYVFMIICLYFLFKRYCSEKAVLYTVLSAVFPFLAPIFIFAIRNNRTEQL